MTAVLLVAVGGAIGSAARYLVANAAQSASRTTAFPWGTLAVNVLGCFAIGALAQLAESRGMFSDATRRFLFVGVLGGFTTFSAFGHDTVSLLRGGAGAAAFANVAAQIVLGIGGVWAGHAAAQALGA